MLQHYRAKKQNALMFIVYILVGIFMWGIVDDMALLSLYSHDFHD